MKFRLLLIKRTIEDGLMLPFIFLGRLIALAKPLGKEYEVFFFFPFYHTGGAEKVHALIAKACGGRDCIVFFTRKSHNTAFLQKFTDSGCKIRDVSNYTDNKRIYFANIIYRGIVSGYVNRQKKKPVVFNGQCNFGYKLSPWVRKGIKQIELIHSVSNFSYIRIPFLPFISQTVMISRLKIKEHLAIYRRFGIPESFDERINYIPNASEFENIAVGEKDFSTLKVLYSGRATHEKRAHLVTKVAERVHRQDQTVQFYMAGDDYQNFNKAKLSFIHFKGNIRDEKELASLYKACNVICITSSTEGFPLAVIEGMAYGCTVLATPVGDIPYHVKNNENGFLFSSVADEEKIVDEGAAFILRLQLDKSLLKKMAETNIMHAQEAFGYERFAADYQKLIYA